LFNCSTKKVPTRLNEDVLRPALVAYFRVGRLYSKIVTPDKVTQLEHLKQSLDAYQVCSSKNLQPLGSSDSWRTGIPTYMHAPELCHLTFQMDAITCTSSKITVLTV
jgi:hypothetical protein